MSVSAVFGLTGLIIFATWCAVRIVTGGDDGRD